MKPIDANLGVAANMAARILACPVCASVVSLWREKATTHGVFRIDRCTACHFAFVNPRPTIEFLIDFYQAGNDGHAEGQAPTLRSITAQEERFPNSTRDAVRIVRTIGRLLGPCGDGRQPTCLDVGSGYGFFSKEAIGQGFGVVALELDVKSRSVFQEMLGFEATPVFFEHFDHSGPPFDVILMSQVLEHVLDVSQWLAKARTLLRDGGVLAVALPNFGSAFRLLMQEREPYITPPAHLNYFDANNLSRLMRANGFDVREVQWISRVPPAAFEKRVPAYARPVVPLLSGAAALACNLLDAFRLGQVVNVYATASPVTPTEARRPGT